MTAEQRQEFRAAIADEVAILRAIATATRGPLLPADAAHFAAVRADSVAVLRGIFHSLSILRHSKRKPMARAGVRPGRIAEVNDDER